ncbi:hypothetical protein ABPG75_010789 [Micractinium tetrahymenae]
MRLTDSFEVGLGVALQTSTAAALSHTCRPRRGAGSAQGRLRKLSVVAYVPRGHVEGSRAPPGPDGRTQKHRMLAGESHNPGDPEIVDARIAARRLLRKLNYELDYADVEGRQQVLRELLGAASWRHPPWIEPPFHCNYGFNLSIGKFFYCNFGRTILDETRVEIGDRVLMGPHMKIFAGGHHTDPQARQGTEGTLLVKPVKVCNDAWLGGGCIILPGVTVGEGAAVAGGALVTKDVEPYTVVSGNPARVIKRLRPGEDRGAPPI